MNSTFIIPKNATKIKFNLQGNIGLYEIQVVGIK